MLCKEFGIRDRKVRAIAQIIHDADLEYQKFGRVDSYCSHLPRDSEEKPPRHRAALGFVARSQGECCVEGTKCTTTVQVPA
jgi:hypothetical protein